MNNEENQDLLEKVKQAAEEGAREGVKNQWAHSTGKERFRKLFGFLVKGVLILALVIVGVPLALNRMNPMNRFLDQFSTLSSADEHDLVLEDKGMAGYRAIDFENIVMGMSFAVSRLEVYEQQLTQTVNFTQAGLGGLKIFSGAKSYTYSGRAIYTVELGSMNKDSIAYDEETKILTVYVPHAELTTLELPPEKIEINDAEKGALVFWNIGASDEEMVKIQTEAKDHMRQELENQKVNETADKAVNSAVSNLYIRYLKEMDKQITLEIKFLDERTVEPADTPAESSN